MFSVKKGVTLNDFNNDTKTFLKQAGFTETDNISELFNNYLEENELDLNFDYKDSN